MSLETLTSRMATDARANPTRIFNATLPRGLRIALRFRNHHYTLSISRVGVYPSVGERDVMRRSFAIPTTRLWKTARRDQYHVSYIFWNPDNCRPEPRPPKPAQLALPRAPLREITNPIQLRAAAARAAPPVGPDVPAGAALRDPT